MPWSNSSHPPTPDSQSFQLCPWTGLSSLGICVRTVNIIEIPSGPLPRHHHCNEYSFLLHPSPECLSPPPHILCGGPLRGSIWPWLLLAADTGGVGLAGGPELSLWWQWAPFRAVAGSPPSQLPGMQLPDPHDLQALCSPPSKETSPCKGSAVP